MCVFASVLYLDHVKVTFIRENSIDLTVQLLEIAFNCVNRQCVIARVFTDEMMTCKIMEELRDATEKVKLTPTK